MRRREVGRLQARFGSAAKKEAHGDDAPERDNEELRGQHRVTTPQQDLRARDEQQGRQVADEVRIATMNQGVEDGDRDGQDADKRLSQCSILAVAGTPIAYSGGLSHAHRCVIAVNIQRRSGELIESPRRQLRRGRGAPSGQPLWFHGRRNEAASKGPRGDGQLTRSPLYSSVHIG